MSERQEEAMNFTQPICAHCYAARHPGRVPCRVKPDLREYETCCDCGRTTDAGIYYQADPSTVPYPKAEEKR